MYRGRTTLSKFLIEQLQEQEDHVQLAGLLVDVAAAIKSIAAITAKGALGQSSARRGAKLDVIAHEELLRSNEWGGVLAGMASKNNEQPHAIPPEYKRGRYLLMF